LSGDDFSNDAASYQALQAEIEQPSAEDMWGAPPEPLPIDQQEYVEGMRQANAGHGQYLEQQRQQQQAPRQPGVRDVEEDPIGHFSDRMAQTETHAMQQHILRGVESSERAARETIADYDEACEHLETSRMRELELAYPDRHPQAQAIAKHYGFRSPSQLRASLLNQDRLRVVDHALRTNQSPAELYYRLALQRGHVSHRGISRAEARQIENLNDEQFDQAWPEIAKRFGAGQE
jgi:hypothetical protein